MFTMQKRGKLQQTKGPFGRRGFSRQGRAGDLLFIVTICLFYTMRAARRSLESARDRFLFYLADADWKIVFSSHCVHTEANKNTGFRKHKWGCKVLVPGHEGHPGVVPPPSESPEKR